MINSFNQKGMSALSLLFVVVLGIFVMWEMNEYIVQYNAEKPKPIATNTGPQTTQRFCPTGEPDNCNDSNDQFLLTE